MSFRYSWWNSGSDSQSFISRWPQYELLSDAISVEPRRVLKTLMAEVDGEPVCVIVRSDREVSMKKLAAAFAGKTARMMKPADAERLSGYHVGGISPFGQKRTVPVAMEEAALAEPLVYINGGQR